ncbi:COX assembly mitochondrial protein [Heracleum sosnowskyi]|uniref:COX assembly mitochondrial protein n=1 Tax=Heracleum sosnowskyi TaxID=360622 RepID=A0AAD8HL14_9APIA|nr:COX assembly mitochondrial protein [Heracleum sosnowskyi]
MGVVQTNDSKLYPIGCPDGDSFLFHKGKVKEKGKSQIPTVETCQKKCHRRVPAGPGRDAACRHLNLSLANCLVATICPDESEAVRSLCRSGGTALKRSQCEQAQLSLAVCLSSHQNQTPNA